MSDNAKRLLGFGFAAVVLVVIASDAPGPALALAGVLALGVALTHADDLAAIANTFTAATGH